MIIFFALLTDSNSWENKRGLNNCASLESRWVKLPLWYMGGYRPVKTDNQADIKKNGKLLSKNLTDEQWDNACILAHKCSISASNQETSYKVLTNWYFTPARLHAWYPGTSEVCWRCGAEKGTMMHIWWECSHIRNFWDEVCSRIHAITETELELSPECCLLHVSNYSLSRYKKSVVRHMLNAAKTIIPRHWKSTHTPTLAEWFSEIDSLYRMEETVAMAGERTDKFHKLWKSGFIFKYSDDFAKMQNGLLMTSWSFIYPQNLTEHTRADLFWIWSFIFFFFN